LPEKLRKMNYSEKDFKEKVRLCLGTLTDKTFEEIGNKIDPSRPEEKKFDELYTEVQKQRLSNDKRKKDCLIF